LDVSFITTPTSAWEIQMIFKAGRYHFQRQRAYLLSTLGSSHGRL